MLTEEFETPVAAGLKCLELTAVDLEVAVLAAICNALPSLIYLKTSDCVQEGQVPIQSPAKYLR